MSFLQPPFKRCLMSKTQSHKKIKKELVVQKGNLNLKINHVKYAKEKDKFNSNKEYMYGNSNVKIVKVLDIQSTILANLVIVKENVLIIYKQLKNQKVKNLNLLLNLHLKKVSLKHLNDLIRNTYLTQFIFSLF